MKELTVSYQDNRYVLVDQQARRVHILVPGTLFELWTGSRWLAVTWQSGGYKGEYYQAASGERGRLGVGTRVKIPDVQRADWVRCAV